MDFSFIIAIFAIIGFFTVGYKISDAYSKYMHKKKIENAIEQLHRDYNEWIILLNKDDNKKSLSIEHFSKDDILEICDKILDLFYKSIKQYGGNWYDWNDDYKFERWSMHTNDFINEIKAKKTIPKKISL